MEKLKKFLKIPALCLSVGLFVVYLVTLIVNCVKPYSNSTYVYDDSMAGVNIKMELTLNNNGKATMETTIKNTIDTEYQKEEVFYKVVDGKLMITYVEGGEYDAMGDINAFEIKVADSGYSITIKNQGEETARALYIVFMVIGICGAAASGIYIALSKKKTKKAAK